MLRWTDGNNPTINPKFTCKECGDYGNDASGFTMVEDVCDNCIKELCDSLNEIKKEDDEMKELRDNKIRMIGALDMLVASMKEVNKLYEPIQAADVKRINEGEDTTLFGIEDFPFDRCFNDMTAEVEGWVDTQKEALIKEFMLEDWKPIKGGE